MSNQEELSNEQLGAVAGGGCIPPIKSCFRRNGDPVANLREVVSKVDNVPFRPRVDVAHRLTQTPYETTNMAQHLANMAKGVPSKYKLD